MVLGKKKKKVTISFDLKISALEICSKETVFKKLNEKYMRPELFVRYVHVIECP